MRQALATTLLFALISPLLLAFALSPTNSGVLPACCRKNGAHHCSGSMGHLPAMPAFAGPPCASYPEAAALVGTAHCGLTVRGATLRRIYPGKAVQVAADAEMTIEFGSAAHPKRGPPALTL